MYKRIKYFKGLNGLRFIAAYLVLLHHAEQIRFKNEIFNLKNYSLFNNGGIAVTFFFVLSGFLITYLLLKEKNDTNQISVKQFYVRRILRIWPLYFLLVIIGTLIIPFFIQWINHPYEMPYKFNHVILYYLFFSPFMVNILFGHHLLEPLWSIGVEELFYIIWAPLIKFFKKYILGIILTVIFFKIILLVYSKIYLYPSNISRIISMLQFESMAIGGLSAYFIFNRKSKIEFSFLFSRIAQIIIILLIIGKFMASKFLINKHVIFDFLYNSSTFSHILLCCSFAWLIINISLNRKSLINMDYKWLNYLGDISYGIYMYHMLIIFGMVLFLKEYFSKMSATTSTILFYTILTSLVIFVSFLSKRLFEDYFLNLKKKYRLKQP
jgi:peptidoglycan/LPS O-acetylase OafA/YrhL